MITSQRERPLLGTTMAPQQLLLIALVLCAAFWVVDNNTHYQVAAFIPTIPVVANPLRRVHDATTVPLSSSLNDKVAARPSSSSSLHQQKRQGDSVSVGAAQSRPESSLPGRNRRKARTKKNRSNKKNKGGSATSAAVSSDGSSSNDIDNDAELIVSAPAVAASGRPMSESDLVNHVQHVYLHGPGGLLRETAVRRQRAERAALQAKQQEEQRASSRQRQQQHDDRNGNGDTTTGSSTYNNNIKLQQEHLKKLDRHPVLVLNADYQPMSYLPLSMWHWQEAIKAVFSGKVAVVDTYPDVMIRAASIEIPLPSVIALNEYVPKFQQRPSFTKRNVFLRDEYRCQYCNSVFHSRDLSLDHVVPRSRGGHLSWENAVTSCTVCNGRKGCLPLGDLRSVGMKLIREPFVPTQFQLASIASRMVPRRVHATWEPFVGAMGRNAASVNKNANNHRSSSRSSMPKSSTTTTTMAEGC